MGRRGLCERTGIAHASQYINGNTVLEFRGWGRKLFTMCGCSGRVETVLAPRRRSVWGWAGRMRRAERTKVFASIWYRTGHMID